MRPPCVSGRADGNRRLAGVHLQVAADGGAGRRGAVAVGVIPLDHTADAGGGGDGQKAGEGGAGHGVIPLWTPLS